MSRGGSITLLKGILAQRDQTPEKGRSRGICVKNDFHSDYRSRLEWQWQNLALRNGIVTFPMTQCWGFPTRRIFPAWILKTASLHSRIFRFPNTGLPNNFTEMCIGSEAGSYLRRMDFVYHSTLGLRVIKKKKHLGHGTRAERGRTRARPVQLIITMIKWFRTSRLSIKNSLSGAPRPRHPGRASTHTPQQHPAAL